MKSRLSMVKDSGAHPAFAFAGATFAFYGAAMLGVVLFAQPLETTHPTRTAKAPAVEASASAHQTALTIERDAPLVRGERTVYLPETPPPPSGDLAMPIKQF